MRRLNLRIFIGKASRGLLPLFLAMAGSAWAADTSRLVPALGWDMAKQGGFPTSIVADHAGNVWVGTEGSGLWEYREKSWKQFTAKDGLGDDCVYALAVDNLGRIWAGHLNHGVSVYNGEKWQNYGLVDGPLGDRVFTISTSPKDNDVWIATDMGLSRYSEKRRDWDYYTRASDLPSDQIAGLDIDPSGKLVIATQANGVALASADDDYKKWTPSPPVPKQIAGMEGLGFISDLGNAAYFFTDPTGESIAGVLTPSGGAGSPDGKEWHFIRGARPGIEAPVDILTLGDVGFAPPREDWMTTLGADGKSIWIGYRVAGVEQRDLEKPTRPAVTANISGSGTAIIRAILAQPGQPALIAAYDAKSGGLLEVENSPEYKPATSGSAGNPPALPAPAPAPNLDDVNALKARLTQQGTEVAAGEAYYLADDWRTQGDWIGRYGSAYAGLLGTGSSSDRIYTLQPGYEVQYQPGMRGVPTEHAPQTMTITGTTGDLRALYDPTSGTRPAAEASGTMTPASGGAFDDTHPDLWIRLKVPDGFQCLSLFFVNGSAHSSEMEKFDDYDIAVLADNPDPSKIPTGAPLSRARAADFWGGVYKQFLICGPATFYVRIHPNQCPAVNLRGLFLDRVTGEMPDSSQQLPGFDQIGYLPPDTPADLSNLPLAEGADELWEALETDLSQRRVINFQLPFRIWAYRAAIAGNAPAPLLERWRWQIGIWTAEDRSTFDQSVKASHDAIKK